MKIKVTGKKESLVIGKDKQTEEKELTVQEQIDKLNNRIEKLENKK